MEHPEQLVTKEELLNVVWLGISVTEFVLMGCIRELRKVLGDDVKQPRFIQTVYGRGYRFITPVVSSQTGTNHQAPVTGNQTPEKKSLTISQQQPEKTAPPTGPISNNINVATTAAPAREDQLANVIAVVDKKNFLEGKRIL